MTNQNTNEINNRIRDIQLSIKDKQAELDTLYLESERDEDYIEFVQREIRLLYVELDDYYLLYDK